MRNREAEVQEKIRAIRKRLEEGLKVLPTHDHLKDLPVEFEPVDYRTLLIHFSGAVFFSEGDVVAIREILGGTRSYEITHDQDQQVRLSFTVTME
jgi:hypothetical protein